MPPGGGPIQALLGPILGVSEPGSGDKFQNLLTVGYAVELAGWKWSTFGVLTAASYRKHALEKVGGEAPHLFQCVLQ